MRVVFAGEIAQLERQRRDPVEQIARERLERVLRMYRSNKEAAGIEPEDESPVDSANRGKK